MADSEEQVSFTTPFEEVNHQLHDNGMGDLSEATAKGVVNVDEIVDLVGGAQDAIERHIAEDSSLFTEISSPPEPEADHEWEPEPPVHAWEPEPPAHVLEPEPMSMPTVTEPEAVPEPEPVTELEPVPEPALAPPTSEDATETLTEEAIPDSTTVVPETVEHKEVPVVEPESTQIVSEPEVAPQAEPIPEPLISAPAEPAALLPTAAPQTEAPASYAPYPPKTQPHLLMQFPTDLNALGKIQDIVQCVSSRKQVVDLLYWRDVKTTGVVFGAALLLLLSLTVCSIVSVCSYVGLALLSVTVSFRIYKGILQAIQKSDEGHPFKLYLDQEVALSEDTVHKYSDVALSRLNKTICDLRRLFLVEDLVDSIKFAVLMWILTYVGAFFNGLTILILGLVGAFSLPIVYEKHQVQIDHYVALVNNQIKDIVGKIQAKVPGMKRVKAE